MKRFLSYGVATLALMSCSNDILLDDAKQDANDIEIAFESFTNNATKAENSTAPYSWAFINHHSSFQVWGYKNTDATTAVFDGDEVAVTGNASASVYTYSPIRFWDKAATKYEFYAAAPADAAWTFVKTDITGESTQNKGYFTTSSTLVGSNLSKADITDYVDSFDGETDIDKMIASPCPVLNSAFSATTPVQLHFNHILSRLNITIKKAAVLDNFDVKMTSLTVENLINKGSFDEKASAADGSAKNNGWTPGIAGTDVTTYTAVTNTEVTTTAKYVLQSLVIPQEANIADVALDGKAHAEIPAVLYADVDDYNTTNGLTGDDAIDADQFAALSDKVKTPAVAAIKAVDDPTAVDPYFCLEFEIWTKAVAAVSYVDVNDYNSTNNTNITSDTFENLTNEEKIKTPAVPAKKVDSCKYHYNLANAFAKSDKVEFNEGWQNTLNITLKPETIEFCADVATWADQENAPLDVK